MNLFVADPHWGWWIVLYFFFGGIAAGLYFLAAILALLARREDAPLIRTAHLLAFPLIALCGIFLIVDLDRPERFWHMILQSEVVYQALDAGWPLSGEGWALMLGAPMLKTWSPMSIGAWAVLVFSAFSFLSFLGAIWPQSRLAWLILYSPFGVVYQLLGAAVGFFVASYTGVLLTATNQPVWSESEWIGALFLTSAASTGIAVMMLIAARRPKSFAGTSERLEKAELWTLVLELAVFLIFLASLGPVLFLLLSSWNGRVLVFGVLLLALIVPMFLQLGAHETRRPVAAALCALAGGFLLRYCLLNAPPELLTGATSVALVPDTLTGIFNFTFLASMVILLGMICAVLYRRVASSGSHRALVGGFFVLTVILLAFHTSTTYQQRQEWWAMIPVHLSPEAGRLRGGEGASGLNRPATLEPPGKIYGNDK